MYETGIILCAEKTQDETSGTSLVKTFQAFHGGITIILQQRLYFQKSTLSGASKVTLKDSISHGAVEVSHTDTGREKYMYIHN